MLIPVAALILFLPFPYFCSLSFSYFQPYYRLCTGFLALLPFPCSCFYFFRICISLFDSTPLSISVFFSTSSSSSSVPSCQAFFAFSPPKKAWLNFRLPTGCVFFNINPASGRPGAECNGSFQRKRTTPHRGSREYKAICANNPDCSLISCELPHLGFTSGWVLF